jgi:hypothetical protein
LANDFMFAILQAKVVLLFDITKKKSACITQTPS